MTDHRAARVLVVDDEAPVRTFAARVLRDGGYEVAVASDGPEALRLIERDLSFDVYVLDVVMPEMMGDELARRVQRMNRDAKVLYFTGFADCLFRDRWSMGQHEAFLEKPVTRNGLLEAVSLLLCGRLQQRP